MKTLIVAALLAGTSVAGAPALLAYQDSGAEQQTGEGSEETQAGNTDATTGAQQPAPQTQRYFLGARPQLKRQVGPALGNPRSILPQPFVPKGSIAMPAPVDEQGPKDGTVTGEDLLPDGTPLAQPNDGRDGLAAGDSSEQAPATADGFLAETALQTIDPSGIGVLSSAEALNAAFWGDVSRAEVINALGTFSRPSQLAPMRRVARRVALSPIMLPAPDGAGAVDALVRARLDILAAQGDRGGYLALLDQLPNDHDWSGLAREFADGHLIAGRIEDACALAASERADSNDPYWLRLAAFCRAVRADRVGVDFQLGILEELQDITPTFYQLIDQILVEAEQGTGAVLTDGLTLTSPLTVDILEATMARLAKVQVPALALEDVKPLAAGSLLTVPGVAAPAKLQLITVGLQQGWLTGDTVAAYLEAAPLGTATVEEALALAATDDHFEIDITLLQLAAILPAGEEREAVLTALWSRAVGLGRVSLVAPAAVRVLAGKEAGNAPVSEIVLRGRLLDAAQGRVAFLSLRAARMGDDPVKDGTLLSGWPLATVGTQNGPAVTPARLGAWWLAQADDEARPAKAALLFTVLEALGETIPDTLWQQVEDAAAPVRTGMTMSPALWRRLLLAGASRDRATVLSLAYRMTAGGQVSDAFAGSLVAALMDMEFETEARQVALHILIGRGL